MTNIFAEKLFLKCQTSRWVTISEVAKTFILNISPTCQTSKYISYRWSPRFLRVKDISTSPKLKMEHHIQLAKWGWLFQMCQSSRQGKKQNKLTSLFRSLARSKRGRYLIQYKVRDLKNISDIVIGKIFYGKVPDYENIFEVGKISDVAYITDITMDW